MKTRLNNYSPDTGNKYDYCGVTLGPKEMKALRKYGLDEGDYISVNGTIDGNKVSLIIQRDDAGYPIRAGNRSKNIYWFEINRDRIDLIDEDRPISGSDDIYISPLDVIRSDGSIMLVSNADTIRKENRKRRNRADEEEKEEFSNDEDNDEEPGITIQEAKIRLAKNYNVSPDDIKIIITA